MDKREKKLWNWALKEARKDKNWAKKTQHNKKWIAGASNMSKEMLQERLTKSIQEIAKEKMDYLILRASGEQNGYVIDKPARKLYEKITGANLERDKARENRKSRNMRN